MKLLPKYRRVTRSRSVKMSAVSLLLLAGLSPLTLIFASSADAATSPSLGTAAPFAVLAGTPLISDAGHASAITGNVGLDPASGAAIGLNCSQVTGTIYEVDNGGPACFNDVGTGAGSVLTTAISDETAAYGALSSGANATCTVDYGGIVQPLVGLNLSSGVYCAQSFTLTGTLTLSGAGPWIFVTRSSGTLVTSGTANVVGGSPCNVWWKVVSSATLGTGTSLIGNILALTSIVVQTNATLNGRALAQNGAVTLDHNSISNQSCNTPNSGSGSSTSTPSTPSTTCTITSSLNPAVAGQPVTLTATVNGADPTGTVTFSDSTTTLGTAALNGNGQASFTTSNLDVGTYAVGAYYAGDSANAACGWTFVLESVSQTVPATTPLTTPTAAPVVTPAAGTTAVPRPAAIAIRKTTAVTSSTAPTAAPVVPAAPASPIVPAIVPVTG